VIRSDSIYVILIVVGAMLATLSPLPAATAVITLGLAAAAGALVLSRALKRHDPWNIEGARGVLREFAPVGSWSVFGAAVQWAFSQGYTYLVAGILGVQAVAAIAATRLLLMPVSLLSSGLFQIMLPTAVGWMHVHGARRVFHRLILFCAAVGLMTLCYCAVMWELRDWIFNEILKKQFEQRDQLLALWCVVFLLIVLREQLVCILVARSRFPQLSSLTACSAVLSLATGYAAMPRLGAVGGLLGVIAGEAINVVGIVLLTRAESRRLTPAPV
jgi:O-antigen/teichoic acid export membrane protein